MLVAYRLDPLRWAPARKGKRNSAEREPTVHYALCTVHLPNAPLAQLVEQLTLNQWVPGSSP